MQKQESLIILWFSEDEATYCTQKESRRYTACDTNQIDFCVLIIIKNPKEIQVQDFSTSEYLNDFDLHRLLLAIEKSLMLYRIVECKNLITIGNDANKLIRCRGPD